MSTPNQPGILSAAWWKASALRALRTAIVIAVPYLGGVSLLHLPWLAAGGAVVLGAIASFATSLFGLPELTDSGTPIWFALLERVAKTAGQSILAGIGTNVLITNVHWSVVLQSAAIASLGSLFIGVLGYLPESTLPTPSAIVSVAPDTAKKQPASGTQPAA